jgi:hypothetical protein
VEWLLGATEVTSASLERSPECNCQDTSIKDSKAAFSAKKIIMKLSMHCLFHVLLQECAEQVIVVVTIQTSTTNRGFHGSCVPGKQCSTKKGVH